MKNSSSDLFALAVLNAAAAAAQLRGSRLQRPGSTRKRAAAAGLNWCALDEQTPALPNHHHRHDGWSLNLLLKFSRLYAEACADQQADRLAELRYAEFAGGGVGWDAKAASSSGGATGRLAPDELTADHRLRHDARRATACRSMASQPGYPQGRAGPRRQWLFVVAAWRRSVADGRDPHQY